ncbi:PLP-dependent aminotransferase family protein [Streptomyces europaeiscabiei]|uniref:PLP-dependent aminotransferase family protein n=4 Tax=Streptomyces europaeiscabiei TaxID=146819 RepID=A0ABU4NJJ9_9ACTN|nr:PLP-dependent aminotransferase family protein [Streptomyces europaeiscabiei]MDX2762553.1 PLP-dependent aminotransferase family protein [Streptomyces europaeiscabiei]MDX3543667.1 PLP-dependent aminotransferase family protein [Streptomyces europaeiscabiei]MDX3553496.1 PLP-dependent aminotransferase family protein [Streptomyces europaeiscabiei]MDX3701600.1 PLP-dependent aminotransferase family protein [Streptomyces europaeiscabiei]MDX3709537.1 PLP-dependent aminotransferase family protein [Str
MVDSWVNSAERIGADLHLELSGGGGRRAALIRALRDAVRGGRLPPGTRLPPYRSLAADLGVARNTVADAYAELVAEGWLTARQGSGTRVAERAAPLGAPARVPRKAPPRARGPRHDLRQGTPDASAFPRAAWAASYRRALTQAPNEAFGPGDPAGRSELREALTEYLARARGVRTEPSRIVICSGFAHALRLLFDGRVLRGPLAVESYGLGFHRELLTAASVRTVPLPLDEDGARVDGLGRERAVLLTPAHQFPTGGPLHPVRRAAVVDWARARGGLILEDDYDGEFRYDRKPVGAVQGLDPERVVHIGSVSKSLSPALRLGWMVLPEQYVDAVLATKGEREAWASVPEQLALADFVVSGAYDRHVRRVRQQYRARRDRLVDALAAHAPHIEVTGIAAGLHAVLRLPPGTERSAVKAAAWRGVALDGLAEFRHPQATEEAPDGLVVGYATPPEHAYGAAVEALCGVMPPG